MPGRLRDRSGTRRVGLLALGDKILVAFGVALIAGPLLLGWRVDRAPAASLMALGALVAGTAAAALCGYPVAAGAAALVFGTGAIMVLPPIGGILGLLFNLGLLTTATVIAARYFRRAWTCPDE